MKIAHSMLMLVFINVSMAAMEYDHAYYENLIKDRLSRGMKGEELGVPDVCDLVGLGNRLIYKNFLDLLELLFNNNLDPNKVVQIVPGKKFSAPLMYTAAFQLNFAAIKLLIAHKADVTCICIKERNCALHIVCNFCAAAYDDQMNNILQIIDYLLDHDAPINAQDYFGLTPLMCVVQDEYKLRPHIQLAIAQRLLGRGADVTLVSKDNLGIGSPFNCKTAQEIALINKRPALAALIESYRSQK